MNYHFLLDIALILLSTKLLGLLTKKIHMPQVVGALLAGLVLGPACLNLLQETEFLKQTSELGVIILMFAAGLETNITELKKSGKASFVIALIGVFVPIAGGFGVAYFFNSEAIAGPNANIFLQNIFIGVVLTATSVSITVETLKELGKLSTRAGNAILGAALIDDILGIIALTVITSAAGSSSGESAAPIWKVLLLIVLFFVFAGIVGFLFYKFFRYWTEKYNKDMRRFVIVAFVFCLLMAYVAESFFGVADITGAFIAGLIISCTKRSTYIASRFETVSYMFLSPVFFASIGLSVVLTNMSANIIIFSIIILIVAVLTKILGCGAGAKLCGYTKQEAFQIGVGMVSRGEVALIVAQKGMSVGLMSEAFFGPMVIMVVITTIITPILLKVAFKGKANLEELEHSELVDQYEERTELELASQQLLLMHEDMKSKASQKKDKK